MMNVRKSYYMSTAQKNKLIRDNIPEIAKENGKTIDFYVATSESEYWAYLKQKLDEECQEFIDSEETEELADILEVIDAIIQYKSIDSKDLERIKKDKHDKRGGFDKHLIMRGIK